MNAAVSPQPTTELPDIEREAPSQSAPGRIDLLRRLEGICAGRGLAGLAFRLGDLMKLVASDLATFEAEFAALPRRPELLIGRGADHLLALGGKRLRPTCVILASQVGSGFDQRALDIAVTVELVHSATLLHDDVVDLSETRRGQPTARSVYGNAASIFAGDWLLVEALRRVERCRIDGLMVELLDTVEQMIFAESIQLENRGRLSTERDVYFQVTNGKTASLFRWAMSAGAQAGNLDPEARRALSDYGVHLGIAFQAIDDLLDLTGDVDKTGKELFTDLREGKMTYPVIVALERDPTFHALIETVLATPHDTPVCEMTARRIIKVLRETEAAEDCLALAHEHSGLAVEALARLSPWGDGKTPPEQNRALAALATIAEAIVDRDL